MTNILNGLQTGDLKNTVAEDNQFAMSASTKKSQEKALKMQDKYDYWTEVQSHTGWFSFPPVIKKLITDGMVNKRATDSTKAIDNYESAKASDSVWIKARQAVGLDGANTITKWSRFGWLIGLFIIIAIIVIFKLLKNKKKATKSHAKAEKIAAKRGNLTVVEAPQPAAIDTSRAQAVLVDRDMEKSIKSCKKYCEKYGIDYDTYLAQYNGDPKALLDFLISSSAEDFQ